MKTIYPCGYQKQVSSVKKVFLMVDSEVSKTGYQKPLLQRGFLITPPFLTPHFGARDDREEGQDMLIELPDNWIDFMKDMPVQEEAGAGDRVRERNVLEWIKQCFCDGSPGLACVPVFIISTQIAERAAQLGLITFDPEARTWKGVRYGAD